MYPGRKPHERCEPGPILLCMGLFSRFCVWAPRCTAEARRMGGANGSRECAPDDKLRGTHQFEFAEMMGFRKGLNPSYEPRYPALRSCFVSRASEISRSGRDKTTRRANHQNLSIPSRKNIPLNLSGKSALRIGPSHPMRGADRESSRTRGGMRWTRELRLTSAAGADGEVATFWRPTLAPSFAERSAK